MAVKKTTKRNELLELKPSSDWKDPAAPKVGGKKRPVHTSGTLYQKESGRYNTPGLTESNDHIISHGKKKVPHTGTWDAVTVKKGTKVKGAQRGVGQETLDGLDLKKRKRNQWQTSRRGKME